MPFRSGLFGLRCHCAPVFFDAAIPFRNMLRLYSADPAETRAFLTEVKKGLPDQTSVRILAAGGTDLRLALRRWQISAWELTAYPVAGSAEGIIVADAGVSFAYADTPIELHIERGRVINISCADHNNEVYKTYLAMMEEARARDVANWQLAKVGIGGNPNARITDVAMETMSVQRTVHFCFGNGAVFTGDDENVADWHGGAVVVNYPEYKANALED